MQLYAYRNTTAGAKRFVPDDGINIAPRCKSPRERIIEIAAEWNRHHPPAERRKASPQRATRIRKPRPAKSHKPVTVIEAPRRLLADCSMPSWVREIVVSVSKDRDVPVLDVIRQCRRVEVVRVRNEIFYLLRANVSPVTGARPSYPQIARWFDRDHTSVLWGASKHAQMNDLPAYTGFDYESHLARKRERHIPRTALETKEGRGS